MFSLKLFGGVSLEGDDGPLTGPAVQRHRLALLAVLGASRPRVLTRDKLMAWLWAERDTEHARGLLNQAVHVLRRTLGAEAILSAGEELQLNPAGVSCDVIAFEEAVAAGGLQQAAALYAGPFLDGFFLSDAPEFERWAERERQRLAASYAGVLESLAERAGAEKNWRRAVEWWKVRVAQDPYDSRAVGRLMLALEASGNRAAAMVQADAHHRLLQEELGMEPSSEVRALAERLRSSPAKGASWLSVEPTSSSPESEPAASGADLPGAPAGASRSRRRRPLLRYGAAAILMVGVVLAAVRLSSDRTARRSAAGNAPAITVDEIARAVAAELDRRERGDTAVRLRQHRTQSIAAYELYLRGSDPALLRSDSAARLGLDHFRRAVALDTTYAAAWAGLARMTLRTNREYNPSTSAAAEAAARRAVALDDSLAEAHATLGIIRMRQYDLAGAESQYRRAIVLEPGTALYHEWLGKVYLWTGRATEALAAARRALELSPLSPSANAELARGLLANGRCDEALAQLEKIAGLEPPLARVPGIAAQCYAQKRMLPEAIATIRPQADEGGTSLGLLGYLLARAGQREEASRILAKLLDQKPTEGEASWPIALVYIGLRDLEQAIPWLHRAVDRHSLHAATEPPPLAATVLDPLRADPRIERLLQRMALGPQNR
ncbi:MAG TPA: BTAD domain-containing putative transcriptional regulator [Gemmatimonadales bacterium]